MLTIQILHVGDRATASVGDGGPIYTGATPEEALGRLLLSDGNWRRAGVEVEVTYGAPPFAAWPAPAVVATPVLSDEARLAADFELPHSVNPRFSGVDLAEVEEVA